ncbi:MAG: hypothetical protein LLG20_27670 [Acidobacteriales bacterium]|nr:hypothetical protein [Terriglobales bacterium]
MYKERRLKRPIDPPGLVNLDHCPRIRAVNALRRMRGGAQSQLMFASDGCYHVVKFLNNPQGKRTLVNELAASALLRHLGLSAADFSLVFVDDELLSRNSGVRIELHHRVESVPAGYHFGSLYPGDPNKIAVYDLLPTTVLDQVVNLSHFIGMLVVDKWLGNIDVRQAVFFRGNIRTNLGIQSAHPRHMGILARMIDHGYTFGGQHWAFEDAPLYGLYRDKAVYRAVRSWADFEPWFEAIDSVDEHAVMSLVRLVPTEWEIETRPFEILLGRLLERRKSVPRMIEALRASAYSPFEEWTLPVPTGSHFRCQHAHFLPGRCDQVVAGSRTSSAFSCSA